LLLAALAGGERVKFLSNDHMRQHLAKLTSHHLRGLFCRYKSIRKPFVINVTILFRWQGQAQIRHEIFYAKERRKVNVSLKVKAFQ